MRQERIQVGRHELVIERPVDAEALIDEQRFEADEFLPYWAELWPSGVALARHVVELDLQGVRVLELGCGLALPSFAAALAGADVLATDWAPEAIELALANSARNGLRVETTLLDWRFGAAALPTFDLVLAADVLYEARNAMPLLGALETTVADGGAALIADPGRLHAAAFYEAAASAGWALTTSAAQNMVSGVVTTMRRMPTREP